MFLIGRIKYCAGGRVLRKLTAAKKGLFLRGLGSELKVGILDPLKTA
jgi:hypothetical protein